MAPSYTPIALQHVNLVVPRGTLHVAKEFYGEVIGFASDPVPQLQKDVLLWYVGGVWLGGVLARCWAGVDADDGADTGSALVTDLSKWVALTPLTRLVGLARPATRRCADPPTRFSRWLLQIHVAFEGVKDHPSPSPISSRHPCFSLASPEALLALQQRMYEHSLSGADSGAKVGHSPRGLRAGRLELGIWELELKLGFGVRGFGASVGRWLELTLLQGVEYPTRFFARDYAGNRLEFAVASS
jgi:hypothetical protein